MLLQTKPSSESTDTTASGSRRTKRRGKPRFVRRGFLYLSLIGLSFLFALPFLWQFGASFKTNAEIIQPGLNLIPESFRLDNFRRAFEEVPFDLWFYNSLFIAVLATIGATLSSAFCAYGFAVLRARGSSLWFGLALVTIFIPFEALLIPEFILFSKLGWLNTPWPLIIPWWFGGGAFNIFLMRQFFKGLPHELVDAARIDGASEVRIFWQIMLPLTIPALTVVAVFHFIYIWNDFLRPLVYLQDTTSTTLPVGLSSFVSRFRRDWSILMAGSVMALVPIIVLFAVAQRFIVRGINLSGVKR
ncbi:MAG: carbohydrate ABC transporter permease [bacterium]|nr:carbohydrate ABC transporter permease [bacterium]